MFVASNNLGDVLDVAIKYWSPDDCRHVVMSKSKLARLVVPPHIEQSVLVNSQSVRVATTDFFYELVFQRHEQPWVENFQALNRAHLFAGNEIVKAQLPVLIRTPSVKQSHNLAFLNSSDFFTETL